MAGPNVSCPEYTLSRQEIRWLTEKALAAPGTVRDGVATFGLFRKLEDIINSQHDLVSDVPTPESFEPVTPEIDV